MGSASHHGQAPRIPRDHPQSLPSGGRRAVRGARGALDPGVAAGPVGEPVPGGGGPWGRRIRGPSCDATGTRGRCGRTCEAPIRWSDLSGR